MSTPSPEARPQSAASQRSRKEGRPQSAGRPLSAKAQSEVDGNNAKIQVQQFLDEWYYRILNSSLAKTLDQKTALTILLDVFELLGVKLDDRQSILALDEEDGLVNCLVNLMPHQMCEDFDNISLQLQTVVHSVARVRRAAEGSDESSLQEIFEEGDVLNSGLLQQILKASVVEASRRVDRLRKIHVSWRRSMEIRIDRLWKASEEAQHATQQLIAIEAQLEDAGAGQKQKSKSMLMNMASENAKTLLKSAFSGWAGVYLKWKAEKLMRERFEQQIKDAEDKYIQYKAAQISNISGVLLRSAMEENSSLLAGVFKVWWDEIASKQMDAESKAKLKAVEDKLKQMAEAQTANAKRVMTRFTSGNEKALLGLCTQSWVKFVYDYHKEKELEDAVKKKEQEVKDQLAQKKEETKAVLNRMLGASENGLKSLMMQNWIQFYQDEKKAKEMEAALLDVDTKLKALNLRQTQNARGVQTRINDQVKLALCMRVFGNWLLETKASRIKSYFTDKLEKKRRQLNGVQQLFRSFSKQLEENLGGEEDGSSARTLTGAGSGARAKLEKRGGSLTKSVDLPPVVDHVGS
mmetsp:Transcript_103597/g.195069  ORF Transcript_103597/g.195069 Transcript_103597/m.195069 type:complete len:578 (+) Transcript_103597:113-1846(+)